ncbi:DnaD domain-containing protein [Paenibacillus thermoaerophilus]|uniref:DnaD domain-containing protein n=1 Tax=Paenibacillus thermoaerophilus TaxID=1215385 RepID=A0ABW2V5C8_9BACL|nr:DnaD domain-containing protein [Paenibacillus thermoaerophilus]TMV18663.1 DnaD domain-containing protein [Paenibacillus thermoaerophilus]
MERKSKPNIALQTGLLTGLQETSVQVPGLLLKYMKPLKLSELEVVLILQIMAFKTAEQNDFPTPEQLLERMNAEPAEVMAALERLLKEGYVQIDERLDPVTDVQYEVYNMTPLWAKLATLRAEELAAEVEALERESQTAERGGGRRDIFSVFEQEFARPLTPMECETISMWLDKDRLPEELILAALKEAVFSGKVHFKYIDRILLEWSRNQVRTVEQAREYAQRFRGGR